VIWDNHKPLLDIVAVLLARSGSLRGRRALLGRRVFPTLSLQRCLCNVVFATPRHEERARLAEVGQRFERSRAGVPQKGEKTASDDPAVGL
jgi:hypothetical protein